MKSTDGARIDEANPWTGQRLESLEHEVARLQAELRETAAQQRAKIADLKLVVEMLARRLEDLRH